MHQKTKMAAIRINKRIYTVSMRNLTAFLTETTTLTSPCELELVTRLAMAFCHCCMFFWRDVLLRNCASDCKRLSARFASSIQI